jgi:hypothetical protein
LGGAGVELVTEALLVTAGQKAGSRRAAIGTADVTAREAYAVPRDAIEVRGGDFRGKALAAQFTVAEVISDDDEDIGFAFGGVSARGGSNECEGEYEKTEDAETRFHESMEYDLNLPPEGSLGFKWLG